MKRSASASKAFSSADAGSARESPSRCFSRMPFAARPSSCLVQVSPPSVVASTTPSWPTAHPFLSLGKYTAVRSELTGTAACFQLAPPSVETTM